MKTPFSFGECKMFHGIPYSSSLFEKNVINEVNAAFSKLYDISAKFKTTDLEPLYKTSVVQTFTASKTVIGKELVRQSDQTYKDTTANVGIKNSDCFNIGHETWIQLAVTFDNDINIQEAQSIAKISMATTAQVYFGVVPKQEGDYENMKGFLKGDSIYVQGVAKKNVDYIIVFSFASGV